MLLFISEFYFIFREEFVDVEMSDLEIVLLMFIVIVDRMELMFFLVLFV